MAASSKQIEYAENPFTHPRLFRGLVLEHVSVKPEIKFDGRGFICALVTARCHIGCEHCMFASNMAEKKNAFNTMPPERIRRLMKLVTDTNTCYLLVSGGGEGFLEPNLMCQIAKESTANITWLVTSGFWAIKEDQAYKLLDRLYRAYLKGSKKKSGRRVCVRVSVDTPHVTKLAGSIGDPLNYIVNLVNIFESHYAHQQGFFLQFHSIEGEECLIERLRRRFDATLIPSTSPIHLLEKSTESAMILKMPSGYSFEITFAKLLLSDMAADMHDTHLLSERIHRWEKDAYINEKDFPSCHFNEDGSVGTDMLVIYDGRVAGAWQSEMPDVPLNIDTDSYQSIMEKTLSDPGVLATIERGLAYRFNIIDEVCPKASLRAKAVNIRDYTSPVLLEEDTVKLYYTIRVLQDYLAEGRIDAAEMESWPHSLSSLILMPREELQNLYRLSGYDIVKQFEETERGFAAFSKALQAFTQHRDADHLVNVANEQTDQNKWLLDKWRLMLKRILHGWYDVTTWHDKEIACLEEVEHLLDVRLLQGGRIYDGLSRFVLPIAED